MTLPSIDIGTSGPECAEPAGWQPLFSGAAAAPYEQAIERILDSLETCETAPIDWGPVLLHAYLGAARSSDRHVERAEALLDRAIENIAARNYGMSLYGGVAGVGWLSAHTDALFERRDDTAFEEIDAALLTFLDRPLRAGYDLISGAVGIGVYFLERLPNANAVEGLTRIARGLRECAQVSGNLASWFTPPEWLHKLQLEQAPQGYYNLGVAHGVPGIVGLLAEMARAHVLSVEDHGLLARAAQWVATQRLPDGSFCAWIAKGAEPSKSRVAWCYGELGVSLTLLFAGRAIRDNSLEGIATEIASTAAARRDVERTFDAALCHGAAGNAHLFNRMFQATRRHEFRDAATFWFNRALEMRVEEGGIGGYRAWKPTDFDGSQRDSPWEDDASFLTGASGIALAFLGATTAVEPKWDRVLLSRLDPIG